MFAFKLRTQFHYIFNCPLVLDRRKYTPFVRCFASLAADFVYNEPTVASLLGYKMHSITSGTSIPPMSVTNATMKLMISDQAQTQLRNQRRDGPVVRDGITVLWRRAILAETRPQCRSERGIAPIRCGNAHRSSAVLRSLAVSAKCIAIASSG